MLAAQAQDRCTRNVWVVNVAGNEAAEIIGILARPATPAFVKQKANAVDVFKQPPSRGRNGFRWKILRRRLLCGSVAISFREVSDLLTIQLGHGEAQFFFESLLQNLDVLVFAKNQRNDEPVISRAHLPIGAAISEKCLILSARDIRRSPVEIARLLVKRRGLMLNVARRDEISRGDGFHCSTNKNAIHLDVVADGEVTHRELVLGGNVSRWDVCLAAEFDRGRGLQIRKSDQDIIVRIELEYAARHDEFRARLL